MTDYEDIISGKIEERAYVTLQKAKEDMQKYMSRKDIPIHVGRMTTTNIKGRQTAGRMERGDYKIDYDTLLKGKIDDTGMSELAIRYAELIIQPLTMCKLTLHTDRGTTPTLKIVSVLPEHSEIFHQFWLGKEIESNTFDQLVQAFIRFAKPYTAMGGVIVETYPNQACTITGTMNEFNTA